jgi:hypothetical protein
MALDLLADWNALHNQPANALGTAIAPMVLRDGHRVIRFDPGAERAAYFKRMLPKLYNGLGITVNIVWFMETPTGSPILMTAFERHEAGFLFSGSSFATAKTLALTPGASMAAVYSSVSHADGAEIDGLLALEEFRLSVTRSAVDGAAQPIYVSGVFLTNTG